MGKKETLNNLPEGLRALYRFKSTDNGKVSLKKFNRLVLKLEQCAAKRIGCDLCPYFKECRDRFDVICG